MRGRRSVVAGLLVLVAGCAALAVALVDAGARDSTAAREVDQISTTPSFIGQSRTQVICAMRGSAGKLVVDGIAEQPERPVYNGICKRRVRIFPDPPVERQSPAAGAPLEPGETVRVWTPCFHTRCA